MSGHDSDRVEAPVTFKAYLMCAFAAVSGIFVGYGSSYINGIMGMRYFIHQFTDLPYPSPDSSSAEKTDFVIPAWRQSLIVSVLSAGMFFGALGAGDVADFIGRRLTIISGCIVLSVGVVLQVAATKYDLLIAGRLVAGFGIGSVSAIVVLYMSEIAPRKFRGTIVSGYQFCFTIGILLASCIVYGTQNYDTSASYRIPIGVQWAWALLLATGLAILPESPRYFVKRGKVDKATKAMARLRGQPEDSHFVRREIAEIVANHESELEAIGEHTSYIQGWMNCFSGPISKPSSNIRRTLLGTTVTMLQQFSGINFIFYFGIVFFQSLGTISNPFLISLITSLVNVCSTPLSFWTVERFGRRPLLIYGALGMALCQFVVAICGTVASTDLTVVKVEIAFICFNIFFFASTWGPGGWVIVGEMFPLSIRSRGIAMSAASSWFWNCIISVITPYMVDSDQGNLGAKVFFIWGALCVGCLIWAYFLVFETKGLTLEQVDELLEASTPLKSSKWKPAPTFVEGEGEGQLKREVVEIVQHKDST